MTPKIFVDDAVDTTTLVRNYENNDLNNFYLTIINSIALKTEVNNDNQVLTKSHVDQFQQENEKSRHDLEIGFLLNQVIW